MRRSDLTLQTADGGGGVPVVREPGIFGAGRWPLTVGGVLLVTLFAFEAMAVATAMPTVAAALDGLSLYGLAFGATFAGSVVAIVLAGLATDRRGPEAALWFGMALFTIGLLIAGTATSMVGVVVGRAALGLGAGGQVVALYVVAGRGYPPSLHKRVFAAYAAAWVVPAVVGPPIAGALVEYVHWRAVFLVAVVLVIPAAISMHLGLRSLPASDDAQRSESATDTAIRVRAAIVVALGVAVLHQSAQWDGIAAVLAVTGGLAATGLAVRHLLPRGTLRIGAGLPAVIALRGVAASAFFGTEVFLPLMLTNERGLSPTGAGVVLTVGALGWSAGSAFQGRASWSSGHALRTGLALITAGVAIVALVAFPAVPTAVTYVGWTVAGLGMGLVYPTLSVLVLELAPADAQGSSVSALQISDAVAVATVLAFGGSLLALFGARPGVYLAGFALSAILAAGGTVLAGRATSPPTT